MGRQSPCRNLNDYSQNKGQYAGDGFPVITKRRHAGYSWQPCIHDLNSIYLIDKNLMRVINHYE